MRSVPARLVLCALVVLGPAATSAESGEPSKPEVARPETVVLLHGLARGPRSMGRIGDHLQEAGYDVHSLGYPTLQTPLEEALDVVRSGLQDCCRETRRLHFVTHSLGGIMLRVHLEEALPDNLGRVVMIAPPNAGSELADKLNHVWLLPRLLGPIAPRLGTDAHSLPNQLQPPRFEFGVIAGTRSVHPLGWMWVSGVSDGTVALDRTKLPEMQDFIAVSNSHSWLLRDDEVAELVLAFLRDGAFPEPDEREG
jgi:hypothetical protein